MELFKTFGFDPTFFVAQIINFLILAFIFKKFLYKPLLKLLKERAKTIEKGLADAQKAQLELEKANNRSEEILKKAAQDAEKILDETKKNAEEIRSELLESSKAESQKIIEQARLTAEQEFVKAQEKARDMSLDLSQKILDKVLGELFTKQEKEKILERNIKLLKKHE